MNRLTTAAKYAHQISKILKLRIHNGLVAVITTFFTILFNFIHNDANLMRIRESLSSKMRPPAALKGQCHNNIPHGNTPACESCLGEATCVQQENLNGIK